MKVNRLKLEEALAAVMPGIAKKEALQQSASFVFQNGKVFAFNDDIAVSHPVTVNFTGVVPAKNFLDLIGKLKPAEIELTLSEGELRVVGSKAKAGLRLEAEICLPLEDLGMPEEWEPLPANFAPAVKFCLFSAGRDANKAALTHIHVLEDCVESCDNDRATRYFTSEDVAMRELMIPASAARHLINYNCNEYAETDGWLHFRNAQDVTFSCRTTEESYPNLDRFLECKGEKGEFPEEMGEMLDRADTMSDGERVNVALNGSKLTVSTDGNAGWYEEIARVKYAGKPVDFDIHPDFLVSMLKIGTTIVIAEGRLLFQTDDFIHIVKTYAPKED